MIFPETLREKAVRLLELCRERRLRLSVAESCTGGLLAALLTDIPGSSDVFVGGAVTYSNKIKHHILGVSSESLSAYGSVSPQVAREMAYGACTHFGTEVSAAITGIAGPDGGSPEKPVGTVHIAASLQGETLPRHCLFSGTRQEVRMQSVETAIDMMTGMLLGAEI